MAQAYVLVRTGVGRASQVSETVTSVEGAVRVDTVADPYDVVVLTEAATVECPGASVVSRVQQVEGITRTLTCSILRL